MSISQAQALLAPLGGGAPIVSANPMEQNMIVIDDNRFIAVPDSLKRLGVQHDHDIQTVTIDGPRYWDGHDMSKMKIYVNYMCANGEKGKYLTQNLQVGYDRMTFDWTISSNVTQSKGMISFLVCIVTINPDGSEKHHWNSELNQECSISEGMECEEIALVKYPDIITQLLLRMDEVEAIATPETMQSYTAEWLEDNHERLLAEIELKAADTLASIPEDYTETSRMAKEAVDTKADAIVLSASGNPVVISDSANAPLRGLHFLGMTTQVTTTGKNLADPNEILPFGFIADKVADAPLPGVPDSGVTTVWSIDHDENECRLLCVPVTLGEVYTFSRGAIAGTELRYGFASGYPEEGMRVAWVDDDNSEYNSSLQFTTEPVPEGCTYLLVHLTSLNTADKVENTWYQVELGSEATEYEPYSGGIQSPDPAWPQDLVCATDSAVIISGAEDEPEIPDQIAAFGDIILNGFKVANGGNYTDKNGQQWLCDELDFERKKIVRRIGTLVLDGTENITREERSGGTYRFIVRPTSPVRGLSLGGGYCTHFPVDTAPISANDKDKTIYAWTTGNVYMRWDAMDSVDRLKEYLATGALNHRHIALRYPLETPVESDMPAAVYEAYAALHTNYLNTVISSPAGNPLIVKYNADTKTYFDNRPMRDEQVNAAVADYFSKNPVSGETLVDTETGKSYKLAVTNGKLTLVSLEV